MSLRMSCRSGIIDQTLNVLLDGKQIYSQLLAGGKTFTAIEIPLPLTTRGEHELTFTYSESAKSSDSRSLAVLFERLQIVPGFTKANDAPSDPR